MVKQYKFRTKFGVYRTSDRMFADFMNNKKPSLWSRFISWLFGG